MVAGAWAVTALALLVRGLSGSTLRGSPQARSSSRARVSLWTGSRSSPARRGADLQLGARLRRPAGTSWGRLAGLAVARVRRCAAGPRSRRARAARRGAAAWISAAPRPPRSSRPRSCSRCSAARDDQRLAIRLHPVHRLGRPRARDARATDVLRYGAVASVALMESSFSSDRDGDLWQDDHRSSSSRLSRSSRSSATATRVPRRSSSSAASSLRGRISGQEPCARPVLRSAPSRRRARGRSRVCGLSWSNPRAGIAVVAGVAALGLLHPVPEPRLRHVPAVAAASRDASGTVGSPSWQRRPTRTASGFPSSASDGCGRGSTARSCWTRPAALRAPAHRRRRVVARLGGTLAFSRPDLENDTDPAVLVVGSV